MKVICIQLMKNLLLIKLFTINLYSFSYCFYYYTVVKKGTDSFWLFNFFCRKSDKDQELANIEKYAATLKVD